MTGNQASPLENELVLDNVFKYLHVPDLKTCRQVSKAWRECGSKALRPLVFAELNHNQSEFLRLVQSEFSTFLESPFVSHLRISYINDDDTEFWTFCGSSIKILTLRNVSAEGFRHAIFKSCPNLERLTFETDPRSNGDDSGTEEPSVWIPPKFRPNMYLKCLEFMDDFNLPGISFLEILSHFPAVEIILLNFSGRAYLTEKFFHSLEIARIHDDKWWKIKSIAFSFEEWENPLAFVQVLFEGNLTLENLDVGGIQRPVDADALRSILIAHASSLKKLNIWGKMAMDAIYSSVDNIVFDKVKELVLWNADLMSTSFLGNFPNLRKLELKWTQPQRGFCRESVSGWVVPNCRELTLVSEHFKAAHLKALLSKLPNLEHLTISDCDNEMFRVICKHSQNLIYLNLIQSLVDDCGMSGFDKEDVERVEEEARNRWFWWKPITVPRPSISNLKKLKWLSWTPEPSISDHLGVCAAICGVQHLPQLQHLRLKGCTQMPVWQRLCEQFPWEEYHRGRAD